MVESLTLSEECRPSDLARALGVKPQAINHYLRQGIPTKIRADGVRVLPTMEALEWIAAKKSRSHAKAAAQKMLADGVTIKFIDEGLDSEEDETFAQARTRKEVAQANREELRVDQIREILVDRKQANDEIDRIATLIRKGILKRAIPRLAPLLVMKDDQREIAAILMRELRKVMEE